MSLITRLYRGETTFDFISSRKRWFTFSAILLAVSIASLLIRGLDGSVDFTGGTIVEADNVANVDVASVRSGLSAIGQDGARVQLTGGGTIIIQTEALDAAGQDELVATVAVIAGVSPDATNVDAVGPTFGDEVTRRAIQALIIFLVVIALFISWRFEWKMALAALAALFHDLIITAGVYSILGFEVTPATVIAILTILGYSLYDTVVVFDKITENVNDLNTRNTFSEIANLSLNQVLMRSINTSLTSLLPVGSLLFIGSLLLGAGTLREFALALFVGIAAGTYSSIFVASPVLALWKEREDEWSRRRYRADKKAARREEPEPEETVTVEEKSVKRLSSRGQSAVPQAEERPTGATPRPPKRRRR